MTYKKLLTLLFAFVFQVISYAQFAKNEFDSYVEYVNVRYYLKYVDNKIKQKSPSLTTTYIDDFIKYDKYFKTNVKDVKDIYRPYSKSNKTIYEVIKKHALNWERSKVLWNYVNSKKNEFKSDWTKDDIINNVTKLSDTDIKIGNEKLEFDTFFKNFKPSLEKELHKLILNESVQQASNQEVVENTKQEVISKNNEENNSLSRTRSIENQTPNNERKREQQDVKNNSFFSFKQLFTLLLLITIGCFIYKKRKKIMRVINKFNDENNFKSKDKVIDLQQKIIDLEVENRKFQSFVDENAELRTANKRLQLEISDLKKKFNNEITNDPRNNQNSNFSFDTIVEDLKSSNILYANAIINDFFHSISNVPNEDTVYAIKLTNIDGRVGKFDIYQNSKARVLKNPDFADGCERQKLSLSPTTLQVEPGEVQKDDYGKWRVTKKAVVKFL